MIRKTVTEAVVEANRRNGKRTRGPKTTQGKERSKHNATKHGILAKHIVFANDKEKAEFADLSAEITKEFQPRGWHQSLVVNDIISSYWKLKLASKWESEAFRARRGIRNSFLEALSEMDSASGKPRCPIFDRDDEMLRDKGAAWECGTTQGTFGALATQSFHETKNVTCGEGARCSSMTQPGRTGPDHSRKGHQPQRLQHRAD